MRIETSFEAPTGRAEAWALLMDVPRIVPCMPGATLRETVGDEAWKLDIAVKLGPVSMQFDTDLSRVEVDEQEDRVTLSAVGRERRGRGEARATIESRLEETGPGATRVNVVTDLALTGVVAQYGGGVVTSVSRQLVAQFADCLRAELAAEAPPAAEPAESASDAAPDPDAPAVPRPAAGPRAPAKPVRGISLLLRALWDRLLRALRLRRRA